MATSTHRILLRNGLLATFETKDGVYSNPVPRRVDVLIEGDRIKQITQPGSVMDDGSFSTIVDCSSKWIAPGFIDTHRHLWMSVIQGQEDMTLPEYIAKHSFTATALVSAEDVYFGELAGALQALHGGTTTILDHFHAANTREHINLAARAVTESGIRCMLCIARQSPPTSTDPLSFANDASIAEMQLAAIEELATQPYGHGKLTADGRVTLGLAYDVFGRDAESDARIIGRVRELGIAPITAHWVAGPQAQGYAGVPRKWHTAGLLGPDVLFSHGNESSHKGGDVEQWKLLRDTGASIGATPEDELGMGLGDPVVFEAQRQNVRVGLGIDCTSVVSADMFPAMRFTMQAERGRIHHLHAHEDPPKTVKHNALTCAHVFRVATLGGAEAIHREQDLGTIEPGKLADIVLYDSDSINLAGCADPFKGIVVHATAQDVDWVFVGGRVVKREGKLVPVAVEDGRQLQWKDVAKPLKERIAAITAELANFDLEERYDSYIRQFQVPLVE